MIAAPTAYGDTRWLLLLVVIITGGLIAGPSSGQSWRSLLDGHLTTEEAPEATPEAPTDRAAIAARLAMVEQQIGPIATDAGSTPVGAAGGEIRARWEQARALLEAQLKELDRPIATPEVLPEESAAASIFSLGRLHEAMIDLRERRRRAEESLRVERQALETARRKLDEAERARRQAKRAVEEAAPPVSPGLQRALETARLDSLVAQEERNLQLLAVRSSQRALAELPTAESVAARIERVRAEVVRAAEGSEAGYVDLARRQTERRRLREAAERRRATIELELAAAEARYTRQSNPDPVSLVEIESLRAQRDAVRLEIELLDAQIERGEARRALWQGWERVLQEGPSRAEANELEAAVQVQATAFEEASLRLEGRVADLQAALDGLESRIAAPAEDPRVPAALASQKRALERLLTRQNAERHALGADRRLAARVIDAIRDQRGDIDPAEQLARVKETALGIWRYELSVVEDEAITVGSLLSALFLLAVGIWVSRRVASGVGKLAERRLSIDAGASQALQTLSFYVLVVGFGLLALRAVHFPLTAFTVLGGALAIGIGFGSQNVMNNFISGLILMLERPVRARDLIEVDGNHGTIERIGARSTQIRATDGRHIVVPNSFFLESNVINWTLSDDMIRTSVSVGVIYGSPTRLVEELIRRVVDEEPAVLAQPEPIIVFEEFGDNALIFDVHFWIVARSPMAMKRTASRIRFRIDDLFRENGLVIAFPQRDVHLDSARPIEVRLTADEASRRRGDGEREGS